MNTDIRLSVGFWIHPKSVKLERRLGLQGIKSLLVLWTWTAQFRPNGHLSEMSVEDIEIAAGWNGDPGKFVEVATELKLLDVGKDDEFLVHDWVVHNSWAADADNRANESRLNVLKRWNMDAYQQLVGDGKKGISKEEYEALKQNRLAPLKATLIAPIREANSPSPYPLPIPLPIPEPKDKDLGAVAPLCSAPHSDSLKLKPKPRGIDCPCSDIAELWNQICTSLPGVVELSETRKKSIRARWKENDLRQNLDWWRDLFKSIEASDFLTGRTGKRGTFGFDWFLSPKNMIKTVEGNYANDRLARGASIPFEEIRTLWNSIVAPKGKPELSEMHAERRAAVSIIWTGVPRWNSIDTWKKFFVWLSADKGFLDLSGCGFDWLMIYQNFVKVKEATYGTGPK